MNYYLELFGLSKATLAEQGISVLLFIIAVFLAAFIPQVRPYGIAACFVLAICMLRAWRWESSYDEWLEQQAALMADDLMTKRRNRSRSQSRAASPAAPMIIVVGSNEEAREVLNNAPF